MAAESKETKKRGPGRPRKTPPKPPPPMRGVLRTPDDPDNIVEWEYSSPATFKKFASYWKSLSAEKVAFIFTPTDLVICVHDYKENTYARHRAIGSRMTSHYSVEPVAVVFLQKDIDLILQKFDKECSSMSMFIRRRNRDRVINFVLATEWEIPEHFEVDVLVDPVFTRSFDGVFDDSVPYPIHLKFPSKYFKKSVADVKSFEDKWAIEHYNVPGQLLKLPFRSSNGHVRGSEVPPKKMILKNDVPEGDHFSVAVYANILKPTSQAVLADDITVRAADDGRSLWFVADVDSGAIPTDILVKIVDLRRPAAAPAD